VIEMVQYNYIRFLYFNKHKNQRAIAKEIGYKERQLKELQNPKRELLSKEKLKALGLDKHTSTYIPLSTYNELLRKVGVLILFQSSALPIKERNTGTQSM